MIHTEIEIHETCQQVSVSEYKDYVQSVSQQADILQHHMPDLCALSRRTNANAVIHILLRTNLAAFKKFSTIQRGLCRKQTLRSPHTHPGARAHTHAHNYTHIVSKEK